MFDERKGDRPPAVIAAEDDAGADDAMALLEIELPVVRLAQVAQRFKDRVSPVGILEPRAQDREVIDLENRFQRTDDQP